MTTPAIKFARKSTAAKLLDMKTREFDRLVKEGALPGPNKFDRWDVEDLTKAMRGEKVESFGGVNW